MAEQRGDAYTKVMSTAAAAAALAAWLKKSAYAAGEIPQELIELVIAMANDLGTITADVSAITEKLESLSLGQGYPPNTEQITAQRLDLTVPNVALQLGDLTIPDDFILVIKSWPTNPAPPGGLLYVSNSKANAENPGNAYPLVTNEWRGFRVQNANVLWVSCTIAPALVSISVEQRTS